jgi:hypothetical protein
MVLVVMLPSPGRAQQNDSCANAREVVSIGPTTTDTERQFEITGETFRVTYDVTILEEDEFPTVIIDIDSGVGTGPFVQVSETEQDTFISTAGPGNFDGTFTVDPPNTARYSITIEDCGGQNGSPDTDGNGADDDQYDDGTDDPGTVNDPGDVIEDTTPDKPLPKTGGTPLILGAGLLLVCASLLCARILRT